MRCSPLRTHRTCRLQNFFIFRSSSILTEFVGLRINRSMIRCPFGRCVSPRTRASGWQAFAKGPVVTAAHWLCTRRSFIEEVDIIDQQRTTGPVPQQEFYRGSMVLLPKSTNGPVKTPASLKGWEERRESLTLHSYGCHYRSSHWIDEDDDSTSLTVANASVRWWL